MLSVTGVQSRSRDPQTAKRRHSRTTDHSRQRLSYSGKVC